MTDIYLPEKYPENIEPYFAVWCSKDGTNDASASDTGELQSATISTSKWIVPSGIEKESDNTDAVTVDAVSYGANTVATIWLSGGQAGTSYTLTNVIETSDSRTLSKDIVVPVIAGYSGAATCSMTDSDSGTLANLSTFTHVADCLIKLTITALPAAIPAYVFFRRQDANNHWSLVIDSAGSSELYETVASAATKRADDSAVLVNGDELVIVCNDESIKVYKNDTNIISYSSASNFKTAVAGMINEVDGTCVLSDLETWPQYCPAEDLVKWL